MRENAWTQESGNRAHARPGKMAQRTGHFALFCHCTHGHQSLSRNELDDWHRPCNRFSAVVTRADSGKPKAGEGRDGQHRNTRHRESHKRRHAGLPARYRPEPPRLRNVTVSVTSLPCRDIDGPGRTANATASLAKVPKCARGFVPMCRGFVTRSRASAIRCDGRS